MIAADLNIAAAGRWASIVPLFAMVGMGIIHFVEIAHHHNPSVNPYDSVPRKTSNIWNVL